MECTQRLRGVWPRLAARHITAGRKMMAAPLIAGLLCAGAVQAQQIAPTPGFDILGFIQAATVDPNMCPELNPVLWGGTVTVNGLTLTVPCNTILQMPAAAFTWAQIFDTSSLTGLAPIGSPIDALSMNGSTQPQNQTGLALNDAT